MLHRRPAIRLPWSSSYQWSPAWGLRAACIWQYWCCWIGRSSGCGLNASYLVLAGALALRSGCLPRPCG